MSAAAPGPAGRPPVARDAPGVADAQRDWARGERLLRAGIGVGLLVFLVLLALLLGGVGSALLVLALPLVLLLLMASAVLLLLSHESRTLQHLLATRPWREAPLWSIPRGTGSTRTQLVVGEVSRRGDRHALRRMTSGTGLRSGHRLDALTACAGGTVWVCGEGKRVVVSPPGGTSPVLARLVRLPDVVGGPLHP